MFIAGAEPVKDGFHCLETYLPALVSISNLILCRSHHMSQSIYSVRNPSNKFSFLSLIPSLSFYTIYVINLYIY